MIIQQKQLPGLVFIVSKLTATLIRLEMHRCASSFPLFLPHSILICCHSLPNPFQLAN